MTQTKTQLDPVYIVASQDINLPVDGKANKRKPESIYGSQGWDEGLPFDASTVNYIWNNHGNWLVEILNKMDRLDRKCEAMKIKVGGLYLGGDTNPAEHLCYGVWSKIQADISLRSADSDAKEVIEGTNTPAVPLLKHTHIGKVGKNGEHKHPFVTEETPDHVHGMKKFQVDGEVGSATGAFQAMAVGGSGGGETLGAGKHVHKGETGSAALHDHSIEISETGSDAPTIDVRGKHLHVVMWKRVS